MGRTLKSYLESLKKQHTDRVMLYENNEDLKDLKMIPEQLHELYQLMARVELPYGQIFTLERALEQSQEVPFESEWFVFGNDNYFKFWLCLYEPNSSGLSFTYWDHESGHQIGDPIWEDLLSFLQELEEDYFGFF